MLQLQYIRDHTEEIIDRLEIKNVQNVKERIEEIIKLDEKRKALQLALDNNRADQKIVSREIGELIRLGKEDDVVGKKTMIANLKTQEKILIDQQNTIENSLNSKLVSLPNAPHPTVPRGKSSADNEVVFKSPIEISVIDGALPHWDLCTKYNLVDFELGNKITGPGFPVYKNRGARLQRALINFFLDQAIKEGYVEIMPPLMVNEASGFGTGQIPDKENQMYVVPRDNYYMIPTAEVPITNLYRDVIVNSDQFPIKHVGYSECFRREAGSYGKDVRGLNRLHEFSKVELVIIDHPNHSYTMLGEMKKHVSNLLNQLNLPYRILKLCGGDLSFTSAITFDFEVWSSVQKKWLEVSSVSNFESFQANRMKLRFKDTNGSMTLAHTLNGSALALPRVLASLLENNQTPDGILVPDVLKPYLDFDIIK